MSQVPMLGQATMTCRLDQWPPYVHSHPPYVDFQLDSDFETHLGMSASSSKHLSVSLCS